MGRLTPAARRAMLEHRWRPGPGEAPADRRSYAQLTGLGGPLRRPGAESPAELVRRLLAERAATDPASPPDSAQDAREAPEGS